MTYLLYAEQLAKLKAIADRLYGKSDRERDEGHRLWLILHDIEDQPLVDQDGKPL